MKSDNGDAKNQQVNWNRLTNTIMATDGCWAAKKFDNLGWGSWIRDPLKDVTFYHQDALGSVTLLTDRYGNVSEKYEYDVWGKAYEGGFKDEIPGFGNNVNVYGFTGQRYEPELRVYSFPYRDYNPGTMRWMTEDPVKDGENWYRYCGNDPVNYIDPVGLYTGYGHSYLTREAAEAAGITNKNDVKSMVSGNVKTDDKSDPNYDWGEHYDNNSLLPGDSRNTNKDAELKEAVNDYKTSQLPGLPTNISNYYKEESNKHIGNGLHSVQDKEAHVGLGGSNPLSHGVASSLGPNIDPDNPKNRKDNFYEAYLDSIQYIKDYEEATGQKTTGKPPVKDAETLYKDYREYIEKNAKDPCNSF